MVATKLAFLFLHYDVRIKGYDLKFRREEFEYAYFMMMKKKQGVKFSSQWCFKRTNYVEHTLFSTTLILWNSLTATTFHIAYN